MLIVILVLFGSVLVPGCLNREMTNQTMPSYQFPVINDFLENHIVFNRTSSTEYISTLVTTPSGTVIIKAPVNNSVISVPLVLMDESKSINFQIHRREVAIPDIAYNKTEYQKIINSLPGENESPVFAKKVLQPFGGLPEDSGSPGFRNDTDADITAISSSVWYDHPINGLRVDSPMMESDYIYIEYGENGDVISLEKQWREIHYIENVPVIPVNEAIIRLHDGEYENDSIAGKNDTVTSITLGYYFDSEISNIPEPVWIFSGKNQWGNKAVYYIYASEQGPVSAIISKNITKSRASWYDNNAMLYNPSAKKNVSGQGAMEIVKSFENNPHANVTYQKTEQAVSGCGGNAYSYHILSSEEGEYRVSPESGEIISVDYTPVSFNSINQSLNISQALMISQEYLAEKFKNFRENSSMLVVNSREEKETFSIMYPDSESDVGIKVVISKNSGQILEFEDENLIYNYSC